MNKVLFNLQEIIIIYNKIYLTKVIVYLITLKNSNKTKKKLKTVTFGNKLYSTSLVCILALFKCVTSGIIMF